MSHDIESIIGVESVAAIFAKLSFLPGSLGAFSGLYNAIGPEMPSDLTSTPVKSALPGDAPVMKFNYDEGHAGRFSVPDTDGASVDFDWVMANENPHDFILKYLTLYDALHQTSSDSPRAVDAAPEEEPEPSAELTVEEPVETQETSRTDEVAIFMPGLNTLHEPHEGETTTVQRLRHYVRVLGHMPMSQVHIGTSFDQGTVRVDTSKAFLIHTLINNPLVPESLRPRYENEDMVWDSRQIDRLQTALSKVNVIDTPIKIAIRKLLATSEDPKASPVVMLAYSRASIEMEAALKKYIEEAEEAGHEMSDIEERLRERVTVVTVGSATADYPDGPAYVHVAAWTDPLASSSGVTARNNATGAGKDAVFLNCESPFHEKAFDNHNFGAVTSQFVSVVTAMNGVSGWRELWETGNRGELEIAEDIDLLTRAMIEMTKGYEWLWQAEEAWRDVPFGALPNREEAERVLRERVGDGFVERVMENFGG